METNQDAKIVRRHREEAKEIGLTKLLNTPVEADPQTAVSADERWEAAVYTTQQGNRTLCTLYLKDRDPSILWKALSTIIPFLNLTAHSDEVKVFNIPEGNKYHFGAIRFSEQGRYVTASVLYVAQGDEERLHGTKTIRLRR